MYEIVEFKQFKESKSDLKYRCFYYIPLYYHVNINLIRLFDTYSIETIKTRTSTHNQCNINFKSVQFNVNIT